MSSKRWTKNPSLPKRYRPGKGDDLPSDDDYSDDLEDEEEEQQPAKEETSAPKKPAPSARSFPKTAPAAQPVIDEEEFETESESEKPKAERAKAGRETGDLEIEGSEDSGDSEEDSDEEDSEEESETSSEDEAPKFIRPTFIKKAQRDKIAAANSSFGGDKSGGQSQLLVAQSKTDTAEERARRKAEADVLVQDEIEKQAAARAAGRKYWDDDDDNISDEVDDTDDIDPEAEYAAWKLRELKRVKRARDAIEAAEKEREEIERRRALTAEEREKEDAEHLDKQLEDRQGRGQAGYMKKYFHRGAFFQDGDDELAETLRKRDIMGARFVDETNREVLPDYMQIRDMTKLGRKGHTKYKDLRSEDTGRWGQDVVPRRERWRGDERFAPDRDKDAYGKGPERSGANAAPVGERQRRRSRTRSRSRSRDSRKRSRSPAYRDRYHRDQKRMRVDD